MSDTNSDEAKGRVKEAAGAITGDEDLKSEGRTDQDVGEAKRIVDKVADSAKDGIDDMKRRLTGD